MCNQSEREREADVDQRQKRARRRTTTRHTEATTAKTSRGSRENDTKIVRRIMCANKKKKMKKKTEKNAAKTKPKPKPTPKPKQAKRWQSKLITTTIEGKRKRTSRGAEGQRG